MSEATVRLTVGQAIVRFLAAQRSERDGKVHRLIEGCFGIFGHGNVSGIGQALLQAAEDDPEVLPYHQARNEQGMVHATVGFARARNRMSTFACTSSIGPGATNMVTGAALATVNRLPVLLLPGDVFSTRVANPVLQELEDPRSLDVSVNDAFRPVSRYFDRVWRPEMLPSALMNAMRVLTDPAETGAVTLCIPQDVGAQAHDFAAELFDLRVWHVARPRPDAAAIERAAELVRRAERPLIVAGGGVTYSGATDELMAFAEATGIPVAESHAGKGSLPWDHPLSAGAVGATGNHAANQLSAEADLVIGIGTRYSDFTTASRSVFADPNVRFVNINVSAFDSAKHAGEMVVADAREGIAALATAAGDYTVAQQRRDRVAELAGAWRQVVDDAYAGRLTSPETAHRLPAGEAPPLVDADALPSQVEVIGAINETVDDRDIVINAAGSMPGDLHKLWRSRDPLAYHVEYGFSCMGYEIAAGLGVSLAVAPERRVVALVGDGSYLMLSSELVTAVAEQVHLTVVLVQNHGYASIGALSDSIGSDRFGTAYRYRDPVSGRHDGDVLPVDLAANAASLGARVVVVDDIDNLRHELRRSLEGDDVSVIQVTTDPLRPGPDSLGWWDVPVAEVSELTATREARTTYEQNRKAQRPYLRPAHVGPTEQESDPR